MLVWAGPAPPASGDAEMAALLFASWGNKLLRTCLNFSAFYRRQIMRSGRKVSLSSRSGNKGHKGQRGEKTTTCSSDTEPSTGPGLGQMVTGKDRVTAVQHLQRSSSQNQRDCGNEARPGVQLPPSPVSLLLPETHFLGS